MAAIEHLVQYLAVELDACAERPALHRQQTAVYQRWLALARAAGDMSTFVRALRDRGEADAAARAAWQDRYRNAAAIYAALGDEVERTGALRLYMAASETRFGPAIDQVGTDLVRSRVRQTAGHDALAPLMQALLAWRVEADAAEWTGWLRELHGLWAIVLTGLPVPPPRFSEEDEAAPTAGVPPRVTWRCWAAMLDHLPYRHRLPFDDVQLSTLGRWMATALTRPAPSPRVATLSGRRTGPLARLASDLGPDRPRFDQITPDQAGPGTAALWIPIADQAPAVLSLETIVERYRRGYQALADADQLGPETQRAYEAIFALAGSASDGPALLAQMAEQKALAGLARGPYLDRAANDSARSEAAAENHRVEQWRELVTALDACPSPTSIEHERTYLEACFLVESAWLDTALNYTGCGVRAALGYDAMPGAAAHETLVRSHQVLNGLFGAGFGPMLAAPHMQRFVTEALYAASRSLTSPKPMWVGDVGLVLRREAWRAAAAVQAQRVRSLLEDRDTERVAALVTQPPFDSPETLYAHLEARFRELVGPELERAPGPDASGRRTGKRAPAAPGSGTTTSASGSAPGLVLWGMPLELTQVSEALSAPARPCPRHDQPLPPMPGRPGTRAAIA